MNRPLARIKSMLDDDAASILRQIVLPDAERRRIEAVLAPLPLLPGHRSSIMQLAYDVRRQGLRSRLSIGDLVRHASGKGGDHVVVGVKPHGHVERWQDRAFARSPRRIESIVELARWADDEVLVWTVDPTSRTPGYSQSRLSDWTVGLAPPHRA